MVILLTSVDVLQREKDHIEGFAAEVAWVTHAYDILPLDIRIMLHVSNLIITAEILLSRRRLLSAPPQRLSCTHTMPRYVFEIHASV